MWQRALCGNGRPRPFNRCEASELTTGLENVETGFQARPFLFGGGGDFVITSEARDLLLDHEPPGV